jgi:hypothetical protein
LFHDFAGLELDHFTFGDGDDLHRLVVIASDPAFEGTHFKIAKVSKLNRLSLSKNSNLRR